MLIVQYLDYPLARFFLDVSTIQCVIFTRLGTAGWKRPLVVLAGEDLALQVGKVASLLARERIRQEMSFGSGLSFFLKKNVEFFHAGFPLLPLLPRKMTGECWKKKPKKLRPQSPFSSRRTQVHARNVLLPLNKENTESIVSTGLYAEFKKSAPWPKSVTATYRGNPAETDPARRRFGTSVADLVGRFVGVRFSYDVMARSNSHALQLLTNDTVDIYENDPSLNWRRYQVRLKF